MKFKVTKIEKKGRRVGTGEWPNGDVTERTTIVEYYLIRLKYDDGTELNFKWDVDFDEPLTNAEIARKAQELYQDHLSDREDQETDKKRMEQVERLNGQEFELGS